MQARSIACIGVNLSYHHFQRDQCSLSPKLIVPKEEKRGKEDEKERVGAEHRSVHKVRV